jgi:hypothetical protein
MDDTCTPLVETTTTSADSLGQSSQNNCQRIFTTPSVNPDLEALSDWQRDTLIQEEIRLTILRRALTRTLKSNLRQPKFSFAKIPKINFVGEVAIDNGGPRQEFFR